jgi:hypothetical protein
MARAALVSRFRPEFDDFLYASIGEDTDGTQTSVLSALARQDVDPWTEAANLAALPIETATQRLASFIAPLTDVPSAHRDPRGLAARLIALLPHRPEPVRLWRDALVGDHLTHKSRALRYALMVIVMLSTQWIVTSCQPLAKLFNVSPPASNVTSPQVRMPRIG